jgi:chromosome segregation ATPase
MDELEDLRAKLNEMERRFLEAQKDAEDWERQCDSAGEEIEDYTKEIHMLEDAISETQDDLDRYKEQYGPEAITTLSIERDKALSLVALLISLPKNSKKYKALKEAIVSKDFYLLPEAYQYVPEGLDNFHLTYQAYPNEVFTND